MKNRKKRNAPPIEMDPKKTKRDEENLEWLIQGSDALGTQVTESTARDNFPDDICSGDNFHMADQSIHYVHAFCHARVKAACPDPVKATDAELAAGVRLSAAESVYASICVMAACKIMTDEKLTEKQRLKTVARLAAVLVRGAIGGMAAADGPDGDIATAVAMKMTETCDPEDPTLGEMFRVLADNGVMIDRPMTVAELHDELTRIVSQSKKDASDGSEI